MTQEQREYAAKQVLGLYNPPQALQARNIAYDPFSEDIKREFMRQYVLNRARGNVGGLLGADVSREARKAWDTLKDMQP